ncbi:hypothetical protein ACHAXS_010268 [Conticribra weissflogii]
MNRGHHPSSINRAGTGNGNDSAAALLQRLSSLTLTQGGNGTVPNSHSNSVDAEAAAQLQLLLAKLATRSDNGRILNNGNDAGNGYGNSFVPSLHDNSHGNHGNENTTDYPTRPSHIDDIGANMNWSQQEGSRRSRFSSTSTAGTSNMIQNLEPGNHFQQVRHSDPMPVRHSQHWPHQSHSQNQFNPQQHSHQFQGQRYPPHRQPHQPMQTGHHPPKTITQREKSFYKQERALLRELVVLTLRHSNGTMLRFVPSIEDQAAKIAQDSGYGNLFKFHRDVVAEGVRISPFVSVISSSSSSPELENNDDVTNPLQKEEQSHIGSVDAVTKSTHNDLQFQANLSLPLLGSGAKDAIALCSECGWLYGRIAAFVSSVLERDSEGYHGSVARALASRLDAEMTQYHEQLSLLESELPPSNVLDSPQSVVHVQNSRNYLTLRSLLARIRPLRNRLRTMAILADGVGSRGLRGGRLLACILRHSLDGNSQHSELVRSIGTDCSIPWYRLLFGWITQGILDDVHEEFFVTENEPTEKEVRKLSGYFMWHKRYTLVEGQIPLCSSGGMMEIITADLATGVLLVGKGINFIRYCLLDKDWEVFEEDTPEEGSEEGSKIGSKGSYNLVTLMDVGGSDDKFQCLSTLHNAVVTASTRIHKHILDSFNRQHHLICHLKALKRFLLLGQGDFVTAFVESLSKEFRGRTSTAGIYTHTLSGVLEMALRTTNARFLPHYVLRNLGVNLMIDHNDPDRYWMGPPPKKNVDDDYEMVPWDDHESPIQDPWDYVGLEYNIDSPLDSIVHNSALEIYHQMFLFLFRLKRIEWTMNNSWRQSTELNHAILIENKAGGIEAPNVRAAAEKSSFLLRRIATIRQTMLHFISNLQNYLMFEVLEGGWDTLVRSIETSRSLDDVIYAHDTYLNEIVVKSLLSDSNEDSEEETNSKTLEGQLLKILTIALKFGKFQDHIFTNSLRGLDRAAKSRKAAQNRSEKGTWGRTTTDENEGKVFYYLADPDLFQYVDRTAKEFDKALSDLLKLLRKQVYDVNHVVNEKEDGTSYVLRNNNDTLGFLLFRLDFSGYYARQAKNAKKNK